MPDDKESPVIDLQHNPETFELPPLCGDAPDVPVIVSQPAPSRTTSRHVRTEAEEAALQRFETRKAELPVVPRWHLKAKPDGTVEVLCDHPDPYVGQVLTMQALGLSRVDALKAHLTSLVQLSAVKGVPDDARFQSLLGQVIAMEPRDEFEAKLMTQMVAIHDGTMSLAAWRNESTSEGGQTAATDGLNKLAKTYTQQLEALKKHRSTGQQIIVKKMTVNEGGQAIVGNVGRGSGTEPPVRLDGNATATIEASGPARRRAAPASIENAQPQSRNGRPPSGTPFDNRAHEASVKNAGEDTIPTWARPPLTTPKVNRVAPGGRVPRYKMPRH